MADWFTQGRSDLGGASTRDFIARARGYVADVSLMPASDDPLDSLRGHAIDGARRAIDDLLADPAAAAVVAATGLDGIELRLAFDRGWFALVLGDLDHAISLGLARELPEAEALVRDAIAAQAELNADLDREFPPINPERAENG